MRANLEGGRRIYAAFQPWLATVAGGDELDASVIAGFERLGDAYAAIAGDAIPEVPEGWNPSAPSEAHLATPYGALFALLEAEADLQSSASLVHHQYSSRVSPFHAKTGVPFGFATVPPVSGRPTTTAEAA